MTTRLYYLMSFLPVLPPLGETPPITMEEVLHIVEEEKNEGLRILAEAFQFESLLIKQAHHRLLGQPGDDADASSERADLPPYLRPIFARNPDEMGEDVWLTEVWRQHFSFMEDLGKAIDSQLLPQWVRWERTLREQMIGARLPSESEAQALETGEGDWDHGDLIAQWRIADDPMAGERVLDQARMLFIEEQSRHYTFTIDELVAYFLKLGLLFRHAGLRREDGRKVLEEVTTL